MKLTMIREVERLVCRARGRSASPARPLVTPQYIRAAEKRRGGGNPVPLGHFPLLRRRKSACLREVDFTPVSSKV
jgi:hypothetical protein